MNQSGTDFFLTGGTALSRAYYGHRYSDDLDFFMNESPNFDEQVDEVFDHLKAAGYFWSEHEDFIRNKGFVTLKIGWKRSDTKLKLDFVNDRVPHFGEIQETTLFKRVDPIRNILSNKLSAIFRYAAKDVADIREIALHESFNWPDMINEAREKEGGLELSLVGGILEDMPQSEFSQVVWRDPAPTWEAFRADIHRITQDMIHCRDNSLAGGPGSGTTGSSLD